MDQSKKTKRRFYCRDVLWETFEQMANDFDCSIDYLINEAMRFYARSKNYQAGSASSQNLPQQPSAAEAERRAAPANGPSAAAPPPPRPRAPTPAPPQAAAAAAAAAQEARRAPN